MKPHILLYLLVPFAIYSCNSSNSNENQNLQDSVIAVHDEIMPLMGGFVRNSIKIDSILTVLPEVKEQNPDLDTAQTRIELSELKDQLDAASESMNDWMFEFEVDHEGKTKEEIKEYLESELQKIQKVKRQFETATEESKIKLKNFQN